MARSPLFRLASFRCPRGRSRVAGSNFASLVAESRRGRPKTAHQPSARRELRQPPRACYVPSRRYPLSVREARGMLSTYELEMLHHRTSDTHHATTRSTPHRTGTAATTVRLHLGRGPSSRAPQPTLSALLVHVCHGLAASNARVFVGPRTQQMHVARWQKAHFCLVALRAWTKCFSASFCCLRL